MEKHIRGMFDTVEIIHDSSHLTYRILRCKDCGAIFVYEFKEFMNFDGGGDEMYLTYVQVESEEAAKKFVWDSIRMTKPQIFQDSRDQWHVYPE